MSFQYVLRALVSASAAIAAMVCASAAQAADLRAGPAAPTPYNWSGFYVGGNFGYGSGRLDWTDQTSTGLFPDYIPGQSFSNRVSGVLGGAQIGFNYQYGAWLFGAEAMLDASALKGSFVSNTLFGAGDDNFEARIKSLGLVTARAGYAWSNVLVYLKGGIALAKIDASVSDTTGANTGSGGSTAWRSGPTFGAGIEYGLTPQLSLALEYDYVHVPSATYELGGSSASYAWSIESRNINLVLAKLNYRFGWR